MGEGVELLGKLVSSVMLSLLLVGMLTLAFNIQPVKASGTIYIRADGSIDPPTVPIFTVDSVTYTFTDNIYDSIVLERGNIVVDGAGYTLQGTGSGTGISLTGRSNVTITGMTIRLFYNGIALSGSSSNSFSGNIIEANGGTGIWLYASSNYNSLSGNNITDGFNGYGIALSGSSSYNNLSGNIIGLNGVVGIGLYESSNYNSISGNIITNNGDGIALFGSSSNSLSGNLIEANGYVGIWLYASSNYNSISGNNITNNWYGMALSGSSNNVIYHNNFIDNTQQVYIATAGYANVWNDSYPSGGNYWSDYTGVDYYSGPYQNITGPDGIGDTPYIIDVDNQDNYPFTNPWSPPDIGIIFVITSKTVVGQGFDLSILINIRNYGVLTETDVVAYANTAVIATFTDITLASRRSTLLIFTWNTSGFAKGNYTISAVADTVLGETYTGDNTYVADFPVRVGVPGDVTGFGGTVDGTCDMRDIGFVCAYFEAQPGDPRWEQAECRNCDVNDDGVVNMRDIGIACSNYLKTEE